MTGPGSGQPGPIDESVRHLRSAFTGIGLLSLPINLLMLTGPLFMLQIYDRVLASGSVPTLLVLGGLAACLFVFYGMLEGIRSRVLFRLGQRLDAQLSETAYETAILYPHRPVAEGDRQDPIRDLETVRQYLSGPGPSAMFDMPWMPVYLGVVFLFHPLLGIVAACGALVMCVMIGLNEVTSRTPTAEANQQAVQRAALVETGKRNSEAISAMGMMNALKRQWSVSNRGLLDKQRRAADRSGLFTTMIKTFRFMLQSAILGVGAWLAIRQEISPGVMIAAAILTSRALAPVDQAVSNWRGFVAARQALARMRETIDKRPAELERLELPTPNNTLAAENLVSGPAGTRFLKGISFSLNAGDGLGVIGPSGAGKTALARTIVGVYPVLGGALRTDGADMHQWDPERRGRFIGYLPQDIQLFPGTVAQNIARFTEDAAPETIIDAARLADAHELITGLPGGYDTSIGPGGLMLSGGQMQRIALARALFGRPFVVVLDEPNSNLDADGEAALTKAIKTMRDLGSIVIVVAHRPSALAALDTLLFMREGRLFALGPKEDVLKQVTAPVPVRVV